MIHVSKNMNNSIIFAASIPKKAYLHATNGESSTIAELSTEYDIGLSIDNFMFPELNSFDSSKENFGSYICFYFVPIVMHFTSKVAKHNRIFASYNSPLMKAQLPWLNRG